MDKKIRIGAENQYAHIHFIGVGGVNMNSLARMLYSDGYKVSGSDKDGSETTDALAGFGITVYIGHRPENISGAELVVYTAAVKADNPEFAAAAEAGVELWDRARLLGEIMRNYEYPICVAGTHGKTTTTSMLTEILKNADTDPTVLVGANLASIGGTLRDGAVKFMVAEACEYFDSFLSFNPYVAVVLNVEADHLDYFRGLRHIRDSFTAFAGKIPGDGALVIGADIPAYEEIAAPAKGAVVTFGLQEGDWTARNIEKAEGGGVTFHAYYRNEFKTLISLSVFGEHNIKNALAAIASAYFLGIGLPAIQGGLKAYQGVDRRFQLKGEARGVRVIDDYAHHPSEIAATIKAANELFGEGVYFAFQPHTFSRTRTLLKEFSECFDEADIILLLEVYSPVGREEENIRIGISELAALIEKRGKRPVCFKSFEECAAYLKERCQPGGVIVTMGAGDVNKVGMMFLEG